ncbi:MAG: ATP-binding protein [Oscillospiraceae bacterium]|nr:ATP-binding protein [Oscillospiraceae bacterium]
MNKVLKYKVESDDFLNAGKVSDKVRDELRSLGLDAEIIRRVSLALYQGEINMIIHANGGEITVEVSDDCITMQLADKGPGISDVETAMQEGYSTAGENLRSKGYGEGMGFTTMKKYTDEMTVHSKVGEGTLISMKVYLK